MYGSWRSRALTFAARVFMARALTIAWSITRAESSGAAKAIAEVHKYNARARCAHREWSVSTTPFSSMDLEISLCCGDAREGGGGDRICSEARHIAWIFDSIAALYMHV